MTDMQAQQQATVKINDNEYKLADLPEQAREQLMNLRFAESEVRRLQAQLAIVQTARNAYQQAFVTELRKENFISPEKS